MFCRFENSDDDDGSDGASVNQSRPTKGKGKTKKSSAIDMTPPDELLKQAQKRAKLFTKKGKVSCTLSYTFEEISSFRLNLIKPWLIFTIILDHIQALELNFRNASDLNPTQLCEFYYILKGYHVHTTNGIREICRPIFGWLKKFLL